MLKLLVKKQLTEIFRAYLYDAKKNRARSKAATVGYIIFFVLLMVGIIGGMFTTLSLTMCRSMAEAGMSWFYFAIMGLMAILLGAFGSVFTTYSSLYLPKDNDQMLSLPIPVWWCCRPSSSIGRRYPPPRCTCWRAFCSCC